MPRVVAVPLLQFREGTKRTKDPFQTIGEQGILIWDTLLPEFLLNGARGGSDSARERENEGGTERERERERERGTRKRTRERETQKTKARQATIAIT